MLIVCIFRKAVLVHVGSIHIISSCALYKSLSATGMVAVAVACTHNPLRLPMASSRIYLSKTPQRSAASSRILMQSFVSDQEKE